MRLLRQPVLSADDQQLSREISGFFEAQHVKQNRVFLNLPRHRVMTHFLRLPSTDDHEIRDMVKMEALKRMPYLTEDIETSFWVTRRSSEGYSDVMMAVVQRSAVERLLEVLRKAGLSAEKIALGSESLFQWYLSFKKDVAGEGTGTTLLMNLASEYADIAVIEKGDLVFTRAFPWGEGDLSFDRKKMADEVRLALSGNRAGRSLTRIIITGSGKRVDGIADILKNETGIIPEVFSQSQDIAFAGGEVPGLGEESFVELISLCLNHRKTRVNLLPKQMIETGERARFKKVAYWTLALTGCILILLLSTVAKKAYDQFTYLSLLNSRIELLSPQAKEAKRLLEENTTLRRASVRRAFVIDIIAGISKLTPPTVTFNLLDYENDRGLTLRGTASSLDEIVSFMRTLESSKYFENAGIKYTTKRHEANEEKVDFEIACALEKVQ